MITALTVYFWGKANVGSDVFATILFIIAVVLAIWTDFAIIRILLSLA